MKFIILLNFPPSRVSSPTWPSFPASRPSQASLPGFKASSASTGRKGVALKSSLCRSGRRWSKPLTQPRAARPWTSFACWSAPANGCTLSVWPTLWSPSWCGSAPGTSTGRRGEATLSTRWPTSTCKTAPPCGGSIGTPTPAPGAWLTPAASWWTIATSWTRRPKTERFTCRIGSSRLQSKYWDWCPSFRRTANCERDKYSQI